MLRLTGPDAVQDGHTSNWELKTLTEVSELGLAYTYSGCSKRWAGLGSLGAVSRILQIPVPGDLEDSETEAE